MMDLDTALNTYQNVRATLPNGLGHVEVSYHGGGEERGPVVYHWASYYGSSIKPTDDDWCYSWEELVNDLSQFDLDTEVWEA